jgi:hypothetical protein
VAQKNELLIKSNPRDICKVKLNISRIFLMFLFIYKRISRIMIINDLQGQRFFSSVRFCSMRRIPVQVRCWNHREGQKGKRQGGEYGREEAVQQAGTTEDDCCSDQTFSGKQEQVCTFIFCYHPLMMS